MCRLGTTRLKLAYVHITGMADDKKEWSMPNCLQHPRHSLPTSAASVLLPVANGSLPPDADTALPFDSTLDGDFVGVAFFCLGGGDSSSNTAGALRLPVTASWLLAATALPQPVPPTNEH